MSKTTLLTGERTGYVKTARSKRALDIAIAGSIFIATVPILAVVALAIRMFLGKPILFSQTRGGIGGRTFEILKFRTMTGRTDNDGLLLPDDQRRHWLGDFLRSTSLDELPTVINILRGDMSIVGPRPLMAKYLDRYSPEQMRRHAVVPGLTGLAQISGRNTLSWEEKFDLDLAYVDSHSMGTDIAILIQTVRTVAKREGADGIDHTNEFMGGPPSIVCKS